MRSYNDEHAGCMPSLDVMSLKHVAYVFDAMIYYMRTVDETAPDVMINSDKIGINPWPELEEEESKVRVKSCPIPHRPLAHRYDVNTLHPLSSCCRCLWTV